MKAREALSHIEKQGWVVASIRGSHHKLRHPELGWGIFAFRPQDEIKPSELPQLDKRFSLNPTLTNQAEDVQAERRQQVRQQVEDRQHRLPRGFPFDRKRFANALQVARLSAGLSRNELASNLGLDEGTLRHYEGERNQPTLERLYAIKEYFNWSDFYGAPLAETTLPTPDDIPTLDAPEDVPPPPTPDDVPVLLGPENVPAPTIPLDGPFQVTPSDIPTRIIPDDIPDQSIPSDKPPLTAPVPDVKAVIVAELDKLLFQVSNLQSEARVLRQENERLRERLEKAISFLREGATDD